jgi:hypothetical protein
MPLFCARLLVICRVNDGKPKRRVTCDSPFVLLEAEDEEHAFARALELGKQQEAAYTNAKGQQVRWSFVRVEQVKQLQPQLDGQEVGSLLNLHTFDEPVQYKKRFNPRAHLPIFS